MDKKELMAIAYVLTDIRVHLFALINLLVEKNIIDADEYYEIQKKCEVSEGIPVLKEIQRLFEVVQGESGKS